MIENFYIVDIEAPDYQLALQSVPEEIPITSTSKFEEVDIPCRSDPKQLWYTASTSATFPIEFINCDGLEDTEVTSIRDATFWLLSLKMGQRIKIIMGEMFLDQVWIVSSIQANVGLFQVGRGFLPRKVKVVLSLKLDPELSQSIDDLRSAIR